VRFHHLVAIERIKRPASANGLEENYGDGVEVSPRAGIFRIPNLLGGHVVYGSQDGSGFGEPPVIRCQGEAKVSKFYLATGRNQDVGRGNVAVSDPEGVGVL
jgi:hypothetical protein